jgi:leucyl aminopeptidase (aminopeptidase T)
MFFVFFFALGANQHIIDEHYDELVQIFHKDLARQIHKVGRDFYQSKIHHCLLVRTIPQNEGKLQKVTCLYFQQILSRSKIDFRECMRTMELIKQTINPRQRVHVLDGNLSQSMIIHAHALSIILLQDKNYRGSPWG